MGGSIGTKSLSRTLDSSSLEFYLLRVSAIRDLGSACISGSLSNIDFKASESADLLFEVSFFFT